MSLISDERVEELLAMEQQNRELKVLCARAADALEAESRRAAFAGCQPGMPWDALIGELRKAAE